MQKLKKRLVFVTLFLLSIIQVSAVIQQEPIRIAGKVVDGNGDALIGVTVRVKESNVGAIFSFLLLQFTLSLFLKTKKLFMP